MAVAVQVRERVGFHRDVYNSLVKCLIRQRKTGEFCDVLLRVGTKCYYAHKAVLAAASPYFRSMFSTCMKEKASDEIDLTQSLQLDTEDSFKRVLDFMYCGDIEINIDNIEDVLRIADFLLFEDVKDYCRQFFVVHGNLNLSNCLWVSILTEHHSLADVADLARAMVRCRFHDSLIYGDEILDAPAPILAQCFADTDIMRFVSVDSLVRVLLRWVRHDMASRQLQLKWLLESVAGHQALGVLQWSGNEKKDSDVILWLSKMIGSQSDNDYQC